MGKKVSTLKHLECLISANDRRYSERAMAQEKAIDKASENLGEYKTSANEFRGTLSDQARSFVSRAEFEAFLKAADEKKSEDIRARRAQQNWTIGLLISVGLTLAGLVISVTTR